MTLVVIALSFAIATVLIAAVALAVRLPREARRPPGHSLRRTGDAIARAVDTGAIAPPFAVTVVIVAAATAGVLFFADSRLPLYAALIYVAGLSGAAVLAFSAALMLIAAGRAGRGTRGGGSR